MSVPALKRLIMSQCGLVCSQMKTTVTKGSLRLLLINETRDMYGNVDFNYHTCNIHTNEIQSTCYRNTVPVVPVSLCQYPLVCVILPCHRFFSQVPWYI